MYSSVFRFLKHYYDLLWIFLSFVTMVTTPESRQSFVTSVIKFLRKYGFDGLNLFWQYPGCHGSPPRDKHLFTVLIQVRKEGIKGFENSKVSLSKDLTPDNVTEAKNLSK